MIIEITREDLDFIKDYAKGVLKHKGVDTSLKFQYGKGEPLQYDIKGYTGEFVVHKHFGITMPEYNPEYTKKDILLDHNGKQLVCDIKTTVYPAKLLYGWGKILTVGEKIVESNQMDKKIDAFIAVDINKDYTAADILGIISWERFVALKKTHSFSNGGSAPFVPVTELTELTDDFTYLGS